MFFSNISPFCFLKWFCVVVLKVQAVLFELVRQVFASQIQIQSKRGSRSKQMPKGVSLKNAIVVAAYFFLVQQVKNHSY